ncbi:MAG: hypothetical protein BWY32_03812 [bacterium ADurb.Bin243]|nr:MAG: hypothetical protein BWY32_03812 [bacterium ADurb.Bin243]
MRPFENRYRRNCISHINYSYVGARFRFYIWIKHFMRQKRRTRHIIRLGQLVAYHFNHVFKILAQCRQHYHIYSIISFIDYIGGKFPLIVWMRKIGLYIFTYYVFEFFFRRSFFQRKQLYYRKIIGQAYYQIIGFGGKTLEQNFQLGIYGFHIVRNIFEIRYFIHK